MTRRQTRPSRITPWPERYVRAKGHASPATRPPGAVAIHLPTVLAARRVAAASLIVGLNLIGVLRGVCTTGVRCRSSTAREPYGTVRTETCSSGGSCPWTDPHSRSGPSERSLARHSTPARTQGSACGASRVPECATRGTLRSARAAGAARAVLMWLRPFGGHARSTPAPMPMVSRWPSAGEAAWAHCRPGE
jgi:hypothetical protein